MDTSVQQPCQKCGQPIRLVTYYIEGLRMCGACYSALLAKKTADIQGRHRKSLDKLGEL